MERRRRGCRGYLSQLAVVWEVGQVEGSVGGEVLDHVYVLMATLRTHTHTNHPLNTVGRLDFTF